MTASEIIRLINQVPPRYDLVVTQGETTHRILDLSFSHSPAQVTLRLCETTSPSEQNLEDAAALMFAENVTLRDQNADLLLELQGLRKLPKPEATIAELNGEVPPTPTLAELGMDNDPYADPTITSRVTVGDEGVTVATVEAVAPAPIKRTRKSAPFGTA